CAGREALHIRSRVRDLTPSSLRPHGRGGSRSHARAREPDLRGNPGIMTSETLRKLLVAGAAMAALSVAACQQNTETAEEPAATEAPAADAAAPAADAAAAPADAAATDAAAAAGAAAGAEAGADA